MRERKHARQHQSLPSSSPPASRSRQPSSSPPTSPVRPTPTPLTRAQTRHQGSTNSIAPTTSSFSVGTGHSLTCSQLRELQARNSELQWQVAQAQYQRDSATVHAIFAGQEAAIFKAPKKTLKHFPTSARVLTSAVGRIEAVEEATKKSTKKKEVEERHKKKKDIERDDIIRRAAQQQSQSLFTGTLKSKSKRDMIDIAFALGVESEGANADALRVQLNAHFNANTHLKSEARYAGLFTTTRKRKCIKPEAEDPKENNDPRPSLRHRSPTPHFPSPSCIPLSAHTLPPMLMNPPLRHFQTSMAPPQTLGDGLRYFQPSMDPPQASSSRHAPAPDYSFHYHVPPSPNYPTYLSPNAPLPRLSYHQLPQPSSTYYQSTSTSSLLPRPQPKPITHTVPRDVDYFR
ncbi:hypothetical protein BDP27DRAFT_1310571 [Rhodocollybia butyracea]|uniref:Uncharacterized protein n=1 Tax=Rhodocollybia butyracea TaxID=206335 RepID=A0A9P5Q4L9_9AGAR|nr:hypothetical protein BDP27DRAFT_1310571 [Rhodocollybia butyracea]